MTRTWVALLGSVPVGVDRNVEARPHEGVLAVLVAWTSRERPREMALSIDPRAVDTGGPPMTVSWVVYPATCRPLFDAPEVQRYGGAPWPFDRFPS